MRLNRLLMSIVKCSITITCVLAACLIPSECTKTITGPIYCTTLMFHWLEIELIVDKLTSLACIGHVCWRLQMEHYIRELFRCLEANRVYRIKVFKAEKQNYLNNFLTAIRSDTTYGVEHCNISALVSERHTSYGIRYLEKRAKKQTQIILPPQPMHILHKATFY